MLLTAAHWDDAGSDYSEGSEKGDDEDGEFDDNGDGKFFIKLYIFCLLIQGFWLIIQEK